MNKLRRFRHVVRHHYGVSLDDGKVERATMAMRELLPRLSEDLRAFEATMLAAGPDEPSGPA